MDENTKMEEIFMKIEDINFTGLESVRKKCIVFAKDGNTVVKPYKTLYCLEQITNDRQHKNIYIEIIKESQEQYRLFEDLGVICNFIGFLQAWHEIEEIRKAIEKYPYIGKEGLLKKLEKMEEDGQYINKIDIELCRILGEPELAEHFTEYRKSQIQKAEKERQAEIAEQEERERAIEEQHKKEIARIVQDAEDCIRNKKPLRNKEFEGTSLILYLMRKYDIKIPLKTQGWINQALAQISFKENGDITYSYYRGSKDSTVFYKYLEELHLKISSKY